MPLQRTGQRGVEAACEGDMSAVMPEALQGFRPQDDVVAELLRRTA